MATDDLVIVEATALHAIALERTLRAGERVELQAQGFASPAAALDKGLRASTSYTVMYRGEVVAMFGVAVERAGCTMLGGADVGTIWFLTGDGFELAKWRALKLARRVLGELLQVYPALLTIIDARYAAAVRWARRLGFELLDPVPFGPAGVLFHPARLRRARP